jgi:hypothetical protein
MGFSRKRGRPKTKNKNKDYGTAELRMKRKLGITAEPLDLCLKKQLITEEEHEAGIRLRWLYTLRFGSPNISAYQHDPIGTTKIRNDNEEWLKERNNEYENSIIELTKNNAKRVVMNICIFNQRCGFLLPYYENISDFEVKKREMQFARFKDGMEILAKNLDKKY